MDVGYGADDPALLLGFFAAIQEPTFSQFSRFKLELTEVHAMLDPDELIAEYTSDGEVTATGKAYLNRYIGVFRFKDGSLWDETVVFTQERVFTLQSYRLRQTGAVFPEAGVRAARAVFGAV